MIKKVKSVDIFEFGQLSVNEDIDGVNHRRPLNPGDDISEENEEVKAACSKAWTPAVIAEYDAHKAEAV